MDGEKCDQITLASMSTTGRDTYVIHTYIDTGTHTCVHICAHIHVQVPTYTYMYMHICMHTHILYQAYLCTYIYMHTCAHMYTHIHTCTHIHIHAHTYTCINTCTHMYIQHTHTHTPMAISALCISSPVNSKQTQLQNDRSLPHYFF